MANLLLNEIWRVRVGCYSPTQAAINTVHYKIQNVQGTGATDAQMATLLNNAWAPLYKAILSDLTFYQGLSVQRIFPAPPTVPVVLTNLEGAGVAAGDLLPGQVAGIIKTKTAFAGKKYRGRIYLPFPSEGSNEPPGRPTAVYEGAAQNLANSMFALGVVGGAGNTVDIIPVVYHRAGQTTDNITSSDAQRKWATQRRRGDFGRLNPAPF